MTAATAQTIIHVGRCTRTGLAEAPNSSAPSASTIGASSLDAPEARLVEEHSALAAADGSARGEPRIWRGCSVSWRRRKRQQCSPAIDQRARGIQVIGAVEVQYGVEQRGLVSLEALVAQLANELLELIPQRREQPHGRLHLPHARVRVRLTCGIGSRRMLDRPARF